MEQQRSGHRWRVINFRDETEGRYFTSGKMQDLIEGCVKYTVAPAVSKAEYDQTPM